MINTEPLISIIIPVYNVEAYIAECIESVLNQSYRNLELILVDDGSQDNSAKICREYSLNDSRIKFLQKENGGASDARNLGLENVKGEYVTFLDSDDYWEGNGALVALVNIINTYPDTEVIFFRRFSFSERDKVSRISPKFDLCKINGKTKIESLSYLFSKGLFIPSACNKLVRTSILKKNKIVFQKGIVAEDIDWSFYVTVAVENFCATNHLFYAYRRREGSVTHSIGGKHIDSLLFIIEKWHKLIPQLCPEDVRLQSLFLGYCAYQLTIVLGVLSVIDCSQRRYYLKRIKKSLDLFLYAKDRKTKGVVFIYRIFGLNVVVSLLGFFFRLKYKK